MTTTFKINQSCDYINKNLQDNNINYTIEKRADNFYYLAEQVNETIKEDCGIYKNKTDIVEALNKVIKDEYTVKENTDAKELIDAIRNKVKTLPTATWTYLNGDYGKPTKYVFCDEADEYIEK